MAASGKDRQPSTEQMRRFAKKVRSPKTRRVTLANAMCMVWGERLILGPEPATFKGRSNRKSVQPVKVSSGETLIWDGRFSLTAQRDLVVSLADQGNMDEKLTQVERVYYPSMPETVPSFASFLKKEQLVRDRLNGFLGRTV